jgi:hypothetical protein
MRLIALIVLAGIAPFSAGQEVPSREAIEPAVTTTPAAAKPETGAASAKQGGSKRVMDRIELDATQITGNRELPKVLYIVPWKDPAMVAVAGRPVNSLVDEALAPVDRDVFRRQGRYFEPLYGAGRGQRPEQPAGTGETPRD